MSPGIIRVLRRTRMMKFIRERVQLKRSVYFAASCPRATALCMLWAQGYIKELKKKQLVQFFFVRVTDGDAQIREDESRVRRAKPRLKTSNESKEQTNSSTFGA